MPVSEVRLKFRLTITQNLKQILSNCLQGIIIKKTGLNKPGLLFIQINYFFLLLGTSFKVFINAISSFFSLSERFNGSADNV